MQEPFFFPIFLHPIKSNKNLSHALRCAIEDRGWCELPHASESQAKWTPPSAHVNTCTNSFICSKSPHPRGLFIFGVNLRCGATFGLLPCGTTWSNFSHNWVSKLVRYETQLISQGARIFTQASMLIRNPDWIQNFNQPYQKGPWPIFLCMWSIGFHI